nr:hypothetical protein [Tanacetum cinerariifolium]
PYYQAPKSDNPYASTPKQSSSTRSNASTKFKGKDIAKPITPPFESAFEEDSDLEPAQRDKDMQKNMALIVKYIKKIYKPTNNNIRTSSNSKNKNMDTSPRQSEKSDWLAYMDEEIDEQELEAHYSFMAKIQEVPTADSGTDTEPLEQTDQKNSVECDDERVTLDNLIANLKLDVDENKRTQKQLKKENTSLGHELKEFKSILAETSRTLGDSNSIWDSCLIAIQNKQNELETYKTLNDRTVDYDKLEHKLNKKKLT